jgi:hypothetical protein
LHHPFGEHRGHDALTQAKHLAVVGQHRPFDRVGIGGDGGAPPHLVGRDGFSKPPPPKSAALSTSPLASASAALVQVTGYSVLSYDVRHVEVPNFLCPSILLQAFLYEVLEVHSRVVVGTDRHHVSSVVHLFGAPL